MMHSHAWSEKIRSGLPEQDWSLRDQAKHHKEKKHLQDPEQKAEKKEQRDVAQHFAQEEYDGHRAVMRATHSLKEQIAFAHDMDEYIESLWEIDDETHKRLKQRITHLWHGVSSETMMLRLQQYQIQQQKETLTHDDVEACFIAEWSEILAEQAFSLGQVGLYDQMMKYRYQLDEQQQEELRKQTLEFLADMTDKYLEIYEISVQWTAHGLEIRVTTVSWETKTLTLSSDDCRRLWMQQSKSRFLNNLDGDQISILKDLVQEAQQKQQPQSKEDVILKGEERQMSESLSHGKG